MNPKRMWCARPRPRWKSDSRPIVCVGERLAERESGQHRSRARRAVRWRHRRRSTPEQFAKIVIAYEPVWAIGTGKTATPEIAEDAHRFIREQVARSALAKSARQNVRILYGGSVKPDNVKALMAKEEIDGVLVGGASLDPASFAAIVDYLTGASFPAAADFPDRVCRHPRLHDDYSAAAVLCAILWERRISRWGSCSRATRFAN